MSRLRGLRNDKELKTLRRFSMAQASAGLIWTTSPFLVSCATFVAFALTEKRALTAEIIFPALSLFNLLSFPLGAFPMAISSLVEANIAVRRLQAFFTSDELQADAVMREEISESQTSEHVIRVRKAAFSWTQKREVPSLQIERFEADAGSFCCIIGGVGSGKSTFLQALLGAIWKAHGDVHLAGAIAYVPQVPWIQSKSVRENIVFGHVWDPQFYSTVIEACALQDDISGLAKHDETEVGGKGITLSGGQKARVALARALYARADVYLLDDCLSAVDQHVGQHLIDRVFGPHGLLRNRTRIFATNSFSILPHASQILLLSNGHVVEEADFEEARRRGGAIAQLLKNHSRDEESPKSQSRDEDKLASQPTDIFPSYSGDLPPSERERTAEPPVDTMIKPVQAQFSARIRNSKAPSGDAETAVSSHGPSGWAKPSQRASWRAYLDYAHATSLPGLVIYFISLIGSQLASAGSRIWIKVWADSNQRNGANGNGAMYIGVYFAFGIGSAMARAVEELCLYVLCGLAVWLPFGARASTVDHH